MTLGSRCSPCGYDALTSTESPSSQSSDSSSSSILKFPHNNTSVIKIGSVKVRFTQNFGSNDYEMVPLREIAAKHEEDEEQKCCGVPWYPSRIPLAIHANNRCTISLSRHNITGEDRRNFTKTPVRRCSSARSQPVASVRPALINCFGKRENKSSPEPDNNSSAIGDRCACCKCLSRQNVHFESNGSSGCAICGCHDRSLISCKIQSTESTLDRFQKFRFGGDRTARNNAGRRGSGGSHKKKAQRSSDKSVNLKKLTDKLKQTSSPHPETTTSGEDTAAPIVENDVAAKKPPSPKLTQIVIPLKSDESMDEKDDIFEGVNLKLTKPESRTIVGSYYQRSIPFRSASFSQVFYSPEDRKYVRNSLRKQNSNKRIVPGGENSATLPRASSSAQAVDGGKENLEQAFLNFFPVEAKEKLDERAANNGDCSKATDVPDRAGSDGDYPKANNESDRAASDGDCPKMKGEADRAFSDDEYPKSRKSKSESDQAASDGDCPKASEERISLIESEPAEPLKSSVVPVIAPESSNTFPQPPKRNKHKHKHRHRHFGRLYFSDENIFTPNGVENEPTDTSERKQVETISVTITTPQTSDNEADHQKEAESTTVEVNFHDEQDQLRSHESLIVSTPPIEGEAKKPEDEQINPVDNKKNPSESPTDEKLKVDINFRESESGPVLNQTNPSSPEDALKPYWPLPAARERKLTPQTSLERDDELECMTRRFHLFTRGDSYSEAESDHGDKRSVSPGLKEGRLSPSPYAYDLSDCDSRKGRHSPVPYSKRPLRGPYLEMIVNEQKKPENAKNSFRNLQIFDSRFPPNQTFVHDRAVDDYYLRRSNTSPHTAKLNAAAIPKRKISANIPFSSPSSLRSTPDEKTLIHHQRTISSPSQLEFYPDQLTADQNKVPSEQLLHQLLRGSSERSLVQDIYHKSMYKDTRSHIVVELYDTERSYVESLQILVTKYLQPLKSPEFSNLIEPYVVEEIFYKIPEILTYHEIFLEELRIRLEGWNTSKCIGDIFLDTFTKPTVIDAYIAFITNWKTAKESIKQTCHMKPAFARFLEAMTREHKGKLALDSLLIMPVQRIPRYELLIQSLLKHTEICHPDSDKLQKALRQVHELALRINCTERDNLELEQIESLIEGLGNLVTADRGFLRYDLVMMTSGQGLSRKERALFLFNDLLIITSIKRRSSTVKKPILSNPSNITNLLESNKYKLLSKIPLEHLDIVKVKDENLKKMLKEMEHLTEDVNTLSQMVDLVATLHCPHCQIEDNLRDMLSALNKQLTERHVSESQLSHLELTLNTRNSVENISVIFSKPEKRTNWEETFLEAKARLNLGGDRRLNPEFLTSVPVRKTRAGLQFTCAVASYNQQDVWVCNSDGYVGQVCILTLSPEPAVTSCNGVCNARISSVTCVPVSKYIEKCQDTPELLNNINSINSNKNDQFDEVTENIPIENLEHDIPDIHLDSSSSSDDDDEDDSTDDQKDTLHSPPEPVESTMWLGTEDGVVHIYNCADSLRVKRNRLKIQHNYAVYCILYVERSVFVSLANGDIYVYYWTSNFGWNITEPTVLSVGCVTTPVSRMFLACGKLWCICHNIIKILNIHTLHVENSFSVIGENNRAITSVAVSGFSVYLSLQNSAVLRLVHGITCEILTEINVAPAVTKMLSGTDDIIRQHKAACLRVTSLLACKELLWIGTSAGVILTMPMPVVKENITKIASVPHPVGLPHGHTGHVRFLTLVKCQTKTKPENGRKTSKVPEKKTDANKMLVISGGDGYEDFRSSSVSEIAGREDSTNHLLIWRS